MQCTGSLALTAYYAVSPAGFLDRVRIELRLQGQLQGLGLKPGLVQELLKQRATSNAEVNELRMDLSPMKQVCQICFNHGASLTLKLNFLHVVTRS